MLKFATKLAPNRDKVERARNAGFRSAEIWLDSGWLDQSDRVLDATYWSDMEFVPHFPNEGNLTDDQLQNAVSLYQQLGCQTMVIHKPMLRSYGRRLLEMEPHLRLAVENGRQRKSDFWTWAESHEYLTLDVEHVWKFTLRDCSYGELLDTVDEFLDRFGHKVLHLHMPGYVPGQPEHRPAYRNANLCHAIWSRMEKRRFLGLVVSEADVEFQTDQHLRRDVILFDRWLSDPRKVQSKFERKLV